MVRIWIISLVRRDRCSGLCWSEFACCFRRVSHVPLHRVSALVVIMSHTPLFSESSPTPFGLSPPKPLFPAIPAPSAADPLQNGAPQLPTAVPVVSKPRADTYQDMKLVLHGQPAVVYCPSCKRNVVTNVKGRRSTL